MKRRMLEEHLGTWSPLRLLYAGLLAMTLIVASAIAAPPTEAAVPTGSWSINGNSFRGTLTITSVTAQGNLTGTVYGQPIIGFWNDTTQKITFLRVPIPYSFDGINLGTTFVDTLQVYTGYLIVNPSGSHTLYTLTGSFTGFGGTGATAARTEYGWFAQTYR